MSYILIIVDELPVVHWQTKVISTAQAFYKLSDDASYFFFFLFFFNLKHHLFDSNKKKHVKSPQEISTLLTLKYNLPTLMEQDKTNKLPLGSTQHDLRTHKVLGPLTIFFV